MKAPASDAVTRLEERHADAVERLHTARAAWNAAANGFAAGDIEWSEREAARSAYENLEAEAQALAGSLETARVEAANRERADAIATLARRGAKLAKSRASELAGIRQNLVSTAAGIVRLHSLDAELHELRVKAVEAWNPIARRAEADESIARLVASAPSGQLVHPVVLERRQRELYDALAADEAAAADVVGEPPDGNELAQIAIEVGLPLEALTPPQSPAGAQHTVDRRAGTLALDLPTRHPAPSITEEAAGTLGSPPAEPEPSPATPLHPAPSTVWSAP